MAKNGETSPDEMKPADISSSVMDYASYDGSNIDDMHLRNGNYNYKKLPPGVTTKNNTRLFVRHTYRDMSSQQPYPEEQELVLASTSASRTPNAAFPLKLHETLSQIDENGFSDIIGWLPHGRSFKIFKQKEFSQVILPRYFVMTKKSSFLRQLNLYGFNRFSAGPDQGSYYHEKFLRGLKFLTRRMTRQRVNGNRIRSAGNPDEEPVLATYPACPPPSSAAFLHQATIAAPAPIAPQMMQPVAPLAAAPAMPATSTSLPSTPSNSASYMAVPTNGDDTNPPREEGAVQQHTDGGMNGHAKGGSNNGDGNGNRNGNESNVTNNNNAATTNAASEAMEVC